MTEVSTASRAELEQLMAELHSAHLVNLTGLGTAELVKALNGSAAAASAAIRNAGHNVAVAIDRIVPRLRTFGRLIYLSEAHHGQFRLLSQQNSELGFVTEAISQTFSAPDFLPATTAASAEEDQLAGAADVLALELTSHDCLIGISGAQESPYLDAVMKSAHRSGALTVRVCNSTAGISTGTSANEDKILLSLPWKMPPRAKVDDQARSAGQPPKRAQHSGDGVWEP